MRAWGHKLTKLPESAFEFIKNSHATRVSISQQSWDYFEGCGTHKVNSLHDNFIVLDKLWTWLVSGRKMRWNVHIGLSKCINRTESSYWRQWSHSSPCDWLTQHAREKTVRHKFAEWRNLQYLEYPRGCWKPLIMLFVRSFWTHQATGENCRLTQQESGIFFASHCHG